MNRPIKLSLSLYIDYSISSVIDKHVSNLFILIIKVKNKQIPFSLSHIYICSAILKYTVRINIA